MSKIRSLCLSGANYFQAFVAKVSNISSQFNQICFMKCCKFQSILDKDIFRLLIYILGERLTRFGFISGW